jgi:hypothetical protein
LIFSIVAFSTLAFVRSLFRYAILPIIMVVLHTSIAERACPQFNRSVFISGIHHAGVDLLGMAFFALKRGVSQALEPLSDGRPEKGGLS